MAPENESTNIYPSVTEARSAKIEYGADEMNIFYLFTRTFRLHRRTIFISGSLLSILFCLAILLIPPRYSATTLVQVNAKGNVVTAPQVMPNYDIDASSIGTEISILQSHQVAELSTQIIATPYITLHHTLWRQVWGKITEHFGFRNPPVQESFINFIMNHETIKPIGKSRMVSITFTSADPNQAADIANAIAKAYIELQIMQNTQVNTEARKWIDQNIERLTQTDHQNQLALEQFQTAHNLGETDNKQLSPYQQLDQLNKDINIARSNYDSAMAKYNATKQLLDKGALLKGIPNNLDSPTLKALQDQLATVDVAIAEQSQQYRPDSTPIQILQGQKNDLNQQINTELHSIVSGLLGTATLAKADLDAKQNTLKTLTQSLQMSSEDRAQLVALQGAYEVSHQSLMSLLSRSNELTTNAAIEMSNAQILSPATIPFAPSFPKYAPMFIAAIITAFLLVAWFYIARDLIKKLIHSTDDLTRLVPYRILGILPRFTPSQQDKYTNRLSVDQQRFSEAIKNLYVRIAPLPHQGPRIITISSAITNEGKTTTALSLAMLSASLGQKTIIIDCDSYMPALHHILQIPVGPGVTDYILNKNNNPLEDYFQNPVTNLTVMSSGTPNDFNIMGYLPNLEDLLGELSKRFERIFIDTPPCLKAVDGIILAKLSDQVVHIVRWGKTTQAMIKTSAKLLDRVHPDRIGYVLAQVETPSQFLFDHTDSSFFESPQKRHYIG